MTMPKFKCRMVDHDGADEWTEIESYDAEGAAIHYSEDCDNSSAMECFLENEPIIIVRDPDGKETQFRCSREAVPSYSALEIKP